MQFFHFQTIDLSSWLPCVSWGSLFTKKPVIHLQMAPWISKQLHPQPKTWQSQCLLPQQGCEPRAGMDLCIFRNFLLFVSLSVLSWVVGRRKTCGTHHSGNFYCRDTVILQDNIHKATQDGCDYFWDGFSFLLRNTICPSQAAASVLMLLPSNRCGGIQ